MGRGFPGGCPHPALARGGPLRRSQAPACTHEQSRPGKGLACQSVQLTGGRATPLKLPPDQGFLCQEHNSPDRHGSPQRSCLQRQFRFGPGGVLRMVWEVRRETQRHGIASATEGALWRPGWPGAQPWQGQRAVAWLPSTLLLPSTVTLPVSPHPHAGKGQNYFFVSSSQTWREGKTRAGRALQSSSP